MFTVSFVYYLVRSEQWVQLQSSFELDTHLYIITSIASNEVNVENTNVSGSDEVLDLNFPVSVNPLALLVQIEHMDG